MKEIVEVIKIMDNHLKENKFLGSKDLNIADIAFAAQMRPILRLYITEKTRNTVPNFMKWFTEINSHPVLMKQLGKVWLCQKEFVPDFTFGKEAKKEEKPKKEKKPQPEQAKKEKKEEKKKKDEVEVDEEEEPKPKKTVNPLDELPKSPFNLD